MTSPGVRDDDGAPPPLSLMSMAFVTTTLPPSIFTDVPASSADDPDADVDVAGAVGAGSAVAVGAAGDGAGGGVGAGSEAVGAAVATVGSGAFGPPQDAARIKVADARMRFMARHYRTIAERPIPRSVGRLALALAFTGCMGPTFVVQQYAGPRREPYTLAVLRVNGGDSVRLLQLDGEDMRAPIASDGRLHVELLPGRHALSAFDEKEPNKRFLPATFEGEAGRVYRVVLAGDNARVVEVDPSSDAQGRDVTIDSK